LVGTIPFVTLVGVTTNGTPLQVTADMAAISGVGGNDTVKVNDAPGQFAGVLGVTTYVAVCKVFNVLRKVPNTLFNTLVALAPPVMVAV
jgi:hypothetical protein